MNSKSLRELLGLAAARKDRDLAQLEAALARLGRIDGDIATLVGTHARDMAEAAKAKVPLKMLGQRITWADGEIRRARLEREALIAAIETARAAARVGVAKHAAIEKLLDKAEARERADRERRSQNELPPTRTRDEEGQTS